METWIDKTGNYIYVSPSCQNVTGYSSVEFMKDPKLMINIAHPDDKKIVEEHFEEKIKGNLHSCNLDFRIITKEGKERWIGHSCQSVYNSNGEWIGQRGSNRNINKQKNAELVLIESEKHLRALTQRIDEVAEEERIRISREIHDEIGHLLTALKYDTESLINHSSLSPEQIKEELSGMISMIEALIDSVRKIATDLRPGILDHMGLLAALEWKIKQFRLKNKICCEYTIEEMDVQFTKNETTFIYRILQEIFTNVTRHSKATNIWISITKGENLFIMKISDNGIGFDYQESLQKGSLGLLGMVERAKSIGGEVQIESEFGKGTTTTFILKK
jgi:two-component system sensor histidine kinase UhpB